MKLYVYYKIGTPLTPFENPVPYAHTTNKKLVKAFEQMRNMKYFYKVERHIESEAELKKLPKDNNLSFVTFETRSVDSESNDIRSHVTIAATWGEEMFVFQKSDEVFYELGKSASNISNAVPLMKKKWRMGCLATDCFDFIFKFYVRRFISNAEVYGGYTPSQQLFAGNDDFGYLQEANSAPLRVDMLGLFLWQFADTLKNPPSE